MVLLLLFVFAWACLLGLAAVGRPFGARKKTWVLTRFHYVQRRASVFGVLAVIAMVLTVNDDTDLFWSVAWRSSAFFFPLSRGPAAFFENGFLQGCCALVFDGFCVLSAIRILKPGFVVRSGVDDGGVALRSTAPGKTWSLCLCISYLC